MLILRKKTIFNLILTAMLLPATAVWAETVAFDGLIEPYVVVDIGAPAEGVVAGSPLTGAVRSKRGKFWSMMESSVERAVLEKAKAVATFDGEIGLQKTQLAFAKGRHDRFQETGRRLRTMTRTRPQPRLSGSVIA